jgi:regulator of cell morphogenesis and NO signaling
MFIEKDERVGVIVSRNAQAASIFNSYGVDFYSRGDRSLDHACIEDHVPMASIIDELFGLEDLSGGNVNFSNMNLTELSIYILNTHHKFTEKKVIFVKHTLERLKREYPSSYKITMIKDIFDDLSLYLTVHMNHEEFVIFPFIQKMMKTKSTKFAKLTGLEHPIAAMKDDHRREVSMIRRLAGVTDNYVAPKKSDYALQIAYGAMKELEEDLKVHMHLENNILFPKAVSFAASLVHHQN